MLSCRNNHIYIQEFKYIHTYVHTYVKIYEYIYTYTYICINLHSYADIYTFMYIQIYADMYTLDHRGDLVGGSGGPDAVDQVPALSLLAGFWNRFPCHRMTD